MEVDRVSELQVRGLVRQRGERRIPAERRTRLAEKPAERPEGAIRRGRLGAERDGVHQRSHGPGAIDQAARWRLAQSHTAAGRANAEQCFKDACRPFELPLPRECGRGIRCSDDVVCRNDEHFRGGRGDPAGEGERDAQGEVRFSRKHPPAP